MRTWRAWPLPQSGIRAPEAVRKAGQSSRPRGARTRVDEDTADALEPKCRAYRTGPRIRRERGVLVAASRGRVSLSVLGIRAFHALPRAFPRGSSPVSSSLPSSCPCLCSCESPALREDRVYVAEVGEFHGGLLIDATEETLRRDARPACAITRRSRSARPAPFRRSENECSRSRQCKPFAPRADTASVLAFGPTEGGSSPQAHHSPSAKRPGRDARGAARVAKVMRRVIALCAQRRFTSPAASNTIPAPSTAPPTQPGSVFSWRTLA